MNPVVASEKLPRTEVWAEDGFSGQMGWRFRGLWRARQRLCPPNADPARFRQHR